MTAGPASRKLDAIAIGASAGGVEALLQLLPALPAGLAAVVFVVIHMPRNMPSLMADIFAPVCALPVIEAVDKMAIEAPAVIVAPSDYHLLVDRGPRVALSVDDPVHWSRPSIDVLFESAADVYRERMLGIILTGWNRDGAAGLAAVQRAGGLTVVQLPGSAEASVMPASALEAVDADHVLTLDRIAALLASLGAGAVLSPASLDRTTSASA